MSAIEISGKHSASVCDAGLGLTGKIHCKARGIRQDHSSFRWLRAYVAPPTMMLPIDQLI